MPEPTLPVAPVRSDDPKGKKREEPQDAKAGQAGKDKEQDQPELSEEDLQLQNELEMLIERLRVIITPTDVELAHQLAQEANTSLYKPALESLRTLIRTATSSMTSVPKPLKFLRPHYPDFQTLFDTWTESESKVRCHSHLRAEGCSVHVLHSVAHVIPHPIFNISCHFAELICGHPFCARYDIFRHSTARHASLSPTVHISQHKSI